jgi:acyl carrier protein
VSLRGVLQEIVVEVQGVRPEQVSEDATLEELGIDSMAVAELIVELEIRLGRELPVGVLRRLREVHTLGDVATQLEAALAEPA